MKNKVTIRKSRHLRVRRKINGSAKIPRLSVFRSNKYIFAQIIDDAGKITLVSSSDKQIKPKEKQNKIEKAHMVGITLAKKALEKKIKNVVFDRGGYKYHGRVKSLADGAREGGLIF